MSVDFSNDYSTTIPSQTLQVSIHNPPLAPRQHQLSSAQARGPSALPHPHLFNSEFGANADLFVCNQTTPCSMRGHPRASVHDCTRTSRIVPHVPQPFAHNDVCISCCAPRGEEHRGRRGRIREHVWHGSHCRIALPRNSQ